MTNASVEDIQAALASASHSRFFGCTFLWKVDWLILAADPFIEKTIYENFQVEHLPFGIVVLKPQ